MFENEGTMAKNGSSRNAANNRRKVLVYSVATMAFIVATVGTLTLYFLYTTAFEQTKRNLIETADAQARLIEAVARFDRIYSQDADVQGARGATISQIVDAHQHDNGIGETGEFVLAYLEDDEMIFLLEWRHAAANEFRRIPFSGSSLAEPMRRALSGESGTIIAPDYRDVLVLAAYDSVGELDLGIVAKMDLSEIRAPFIEAGIIIAVAGTLFILAGGFFIVWVNNPLIKSVEDQSLEATLLHRAAEMAAETDSFEEALQQVVNMICEMTGWPVGHVYQISPDDTNLLVPTTIWHLKKPDAYSVFQEVTERTQFLIGKGLPGRILESGEPVWITDVQTDPNFPRNKLARDLGVKGAFGFPVKISGEVVAVLEFFADQEVSPDENLMQTMGNVGEQLSRVFERKRAEEELRQARQAADVANLAKSEFLSNMSHELRTPLNGVLGYAQILQRDGSVTPKQRESLNAIESCGQHLLTLINAVLDLSKIEAGRLEVDKAPCDLHRLLKSVSDIVSPQAESKGLTFSVEVSPEVPRGILTDPTKLKQVLVNLAGNGVKFTDEGTVTLRARESPDSVLQLVVQDTGMGMTPEELEEIFDPFKQAEGGKKIGGTGLGLPISKRLVEALGGKLEVESQPGRGSSFIIALPLVEVPEQDLSKLDEEPLSDQRNLMLAPGQDVTVLVADDRRENRDILVQLLEGVGFHTREARDGKEAIEKLREYDMPLVFMDVRMPVMNGIEATRAIRNDPSLKDKVIIAVSASVIGEFRKQAMEAGFDDFIGKPFRVSEVFDKIKRHLKVSYTASAQEIPPDSEQERVKPGDQKLPPEVAREVARRVQEAVQLGNVSELTALANELIQRTDFTSPYGEEIARLARAFDFEGLSQLASTLVETATPSKEKA